MDPSKKNGLLIIMSTIGAFLIYGLILTLKIPSAFLTPFRENSTFLFVIVLLAYFLIFRLPQKLSWGLGITFTFIILALPLLYLWTSGYSDNGIIGGLLPYKDGKYYYWGAQMILNGDLISSKGIQAAGRPLFPSFLSIFLFAFSGNLKLSIAVIVGLAGLAAFLSAFYFADKLGAAVAALYLTLLYFYIQTLVGFTMSELAGFIFGCLGSVILWQAAAKLNFRTFLVGLIVTMLAISIRTGAFFVFPMLILWAGWVFRGEKRFSFKIALISSMVVALAFLAMNVIYPKLVVEPGAMTNGNFAYALYGQVRGGVGWNEAIKATGTRDPNVVYQAAWDFFLRHPLSFPIGIAKSYRDFFAPKMNNIFPLSYSISGIVLQLFELGLILYSLALFRKKKSDSAYLFLLATFVGICLSIPFLPPIDGGARFYASTMSFFFLFLAYPLSLLPGKKVESIVSADQLVQFAKILSLVFLGGILVLPIILQQAGTKPSIALPTCPADQVPFLATIPAGSYVNLQKGTNCGLNPNICLSDFETHGVDAKTDDFFQELVKLANESDTASRVLLYNNSMKESIHYLFGSVDQLQSVNSENLVAGCAIEIQTEHQSIYLVEQVFTP